jgi:hypothetical protein
MTVGRSVDGTWIGVSGRPNRGVLHPEWIPCLSEREMVGACRETSASRCSTSIHALRFPETGFTRWIDANPRQPHGRRDAVVSTASEAVNGAPLGDCDVVVVESLVLDKLSLWTRLGPWAMRPIGPGVLRGGGMGGGVRAAVGDGC